jgi:hypothetical protein
METVVIGDQMTTVIICQINDLFGNLKEPNTGNSNGIVIWTLVIRDECYLGNASNSKPNDCSNNLPNYDSFGNLEN